LLVAGLTLAASSAALAIAPVASGITDGVPDGSAHPYVGIAVADDTACSGTLISPTIFVTAGHCTDAFAGSGQQTFVTFDAAASGSSTYVTGTPYTDPDFFNVPPRGLGVPGSVGGDIGVIVLDCAVSLTQYGVLPSVGLLDGSGVNSGRFTLVGYGAQGWVSGGGPRKFQPTFTFIRTRATSRLINDKYALGDEFAVFSTSPGGGDGGIGPGDSGSPALVGDGPVISAIGSHVTNPFGSGKGYWTRLDTTSALDFINQSRPPGACS
jgi:hypothetical protein